VRSTLTREASITLLVLFFSNTNLVSSLYLNGSCLLHFKPQSPCSLRVCNGLDAAYPQVFFVLLELSHRLRCTPFVNGLFRGIYPQPFLFERPTTSFCSITNAMLQKSTSTLDPCPSPQQRSWL
jgi:hypothetical protein